MVKIGHTILISLSLYLLTNANPLSNDQKLVENSGAGIVEGDIKLQLKGKILASRETYNLWENGIVPYEISTDYDKEKQDKIIAAMDLITYKTASCIRFVKRTTEKNFIKFKKLDGCYSYIGNIKQGEQEISLHFDSGSTCLNKGTIVHELCHALGFYHEQNRPDRDQYVTINLDNVDENKKSNFVKYQGITFNTPYDFKSVMHYTEYSFSNNGQKTIVPKDPKVVIKYSGSRTDDEILSKYDIEGIRSRYQCPGAYTLAPTTTTTTTTTKPPISSSCKNEVKNCGAYERNKILYCNPKYNYELAGMHFTKACEKMCGVCIAPYNPCEDKWFCYKYASDKQEYCHNPSVTYSVNGAPIKQQCPTLCQSCTIQSVDLRMSEPELLEQK